MLIIDNIIQATNLDANAYKSEAHKSTIQDCTKLLVRSLYCTLGSDRDVKAMIVAIAILTTKAPNFTKMLTDKDALDTLRKFIAPTNAVAFAKMIPKVLELAKQHNLQSDTL